MKSNGKKIVKIIKLGRLHFVFGGFLFFCLGALFATLMEAKFGPGQFIFGYAILFAAHISLNYSNDYFDLESDKYGKPSQFAGGSGILVQNPELKIYAKLIGIGAMITSISLAMIFTFIYSFPYSFILFVIFGNLLGWFYAAPPIRMSYNGASEIATILTGFMMPGMGYFSIMGTINLPFIIFSIPLMIYQFLFINAVQIPDLEGDKLGNKRTLIVRKGRKFGFKLIAVSAVLGSLSLLSISITGWYSKTINFFLIVLISLIPLSLAILSYMKRSEDRIDATNLVNRNLSSLFIFAIITNFYFVYLLL